MFETLKELIKQPYWIIALILGGALVALPCVTIDKDHNWTPHPPATLVPIAVGGLLLLVSLLAFGATLWTKHQTGIDGLDLTNVIDNHGVLSTSVGDCEVRVTEGRIEEYLHAPGVAVVLPSNEYFDDRCAADASSALGAYVNRFFEGRAEAFVSLVKSEARSKFGNGTLQQKTENEQAESFGSGRCLLLLGPLGSPNPLALVSTTTQRAGQGLAAQISCLFDGMHALNRCLADARISEATMPVLGGGRGGIHRRLAYVGLLLAVAEAARYGQGAQRLKRVTIVVFKRDARTPAEVDRTTMRRGLALIGTQER